jgi:hypothetical protein
LMQLSNKKQLTQSKFFWFGLFERTL